jgi:hypothetical protein
MLASEMLELGHSVPLVESCQLRTMEGLGTSPRFLYQRLPLSTPRRTKSIGISATIVDSDCHVTSTWTWQDIAIHKGACRLLLAKLTKSIKIEGHENISVVSQEFGSLVLYVVPRSVNGAGVNICSQCLVLKSYLLRKRHLRIRELQTCSSIFMRRERKT